MQKPMVLMDPAIATKPEMLELAAAGKHRAILTHVLGLIYVSSHETEGFLPTGSLKFVHGRKSDAQALVEVGLWVAYPAGWGIYDWAENQLHRPRVPVSKTVRGLVFERDGFACVHCGTTDALSIDHIVAWANGGSNALDNLQTLCISCNSRKRDS